MEKRRRIRRIVVLVLFVVGAIGTSQLKSSDYWDDEQIEQQVQQKIMSACDLKLQQMQHYKNKVEEIKNELNEYYNSEDRPMSVEEYNANTQYLDGELEYISWYVKRWTSQCESEKQQQQYYQLPEGLKQIK